MYMVNLSMLSTLFMAISDRAARLTNVHKFWPKGMDWLQNTGLRSWCVHQKQHGCKSWPHSDDLAEDLPFFSFLQVYVDKKWQTTVEKEPALYRKCPMSPVLLAQMSLCSERNGAQIKEMEGKSSGDHLGEMGWDGELVLLKRHVYVKEGKKGESECS